MTTFVVDELKIEGEFRLYSSIYSKKMHQKKTVSRCARTIASLESKSKPAGVGPCLLPSLGQTLGVVSILFFSSGRFEPSIRFLFTLEVRTEYSSELLMSLRIVR